MADEFPFVSVIIPTYNRKESLLRTLDSLARQTYPADRFEVIVVDDGSTDDTPSVAQLAFPFRLVYIRQQNQGSAAARNAGASRSQGEVLMFIDDDIVVEPGYIAGIAQQHWSANHLIVTGAFRPYTTPHDSTFRRIGFHGEESGQISAGFTDVTSNNVSVRRSAFFALGMWQDVADDGPTLWGDVDFAYRAYKQGFRFYRVAEAICYHDDYASRDLPTASKRAHTMAYRAVLLFKKYPELIHHIPMFRDKTPIAWHSDPPRLIVRKLARVVASGRASVWAMERLVGVLERAYPSPRLLRPLYRWIIGAYIYRGYRQGLREQGRP